MCYIVVVLRDMVKERWWLATDIKHRKHVKTCYLRDRVSLRGNNLHYSRHLELLKNCLKSVD